MNILDNNNSEQNEEMDAEYINEQAMSILWELCLEPMQNKLSKDELSVISLIGVTLKLIAQKAKCYEELQKDNFTDPTEGDFSRN